VISLNEKILSIFKDIDKKMTLILKGQGIIMDMLRETSPTCLAEELQGIINEHNQQVLDSFTEALKDIAK